MALDKRETMSEEDLVSKSLASTLSPRQQKAKDGTVTQLQNNSTMLQSCYSEESVFVDSQAGKKAFVQNFF
jgi:hypothetical protein